MSLPSFAVTPANVLTILGNVAGSEIVGNGVAVKVSFTSNIPVNTPIVWDGDLYPVESPITATINSAGEILRNGEIVRLLANDPGLNVTGIQWKYTIGKLKTVVFNAPDDGGTVDLSTVTPAPNLPVVGVPVDVTAWAEITGRPAPLVAGTNVANGYAGLDGTGKIGTAQLPISIMDYKGVWNASTNSPTLVDGTGSAGDVYRVGTAGTRNLGSGSITFDVGDYVIYNGSTWEKADTTDAVASVAGLTGAVSVSGLKTALGVSGAIAINVKDAPYSATGDGSTNDTAAFAAAGAAAGVGGHVYVPPGVYIVNGAALSAAHQRWEFAPGAHLKLPAGATDGKIFTVTGDFVTLDGGEWDGNRANVATPVSDAPIMVAAAHCTVRDAYVHDTDGWGIVVHPSGTTTTIDGTVVEGCTLVDTFQGGVNLDCITYFATTVSSNGVRVSGCYVSTSLTPPANYVGVQVVGSTTNNLQGAAVENCHIYQPTDGTGFQNGVFWRYVTGARVTGCYVSGTDLAYSFDHCLDSSLSASTAYAARLFGIELAGGLTRAAVTGCTVDGQGVTLAGIVGDNASNDELTITGNTVGRLKTTSGGQGISMQTGGRAWTIAGNVIRTPYIGIEVYGASTINMTIEGNTLDMESGGTVGFYVGIDLDPFTTGARGWSIRNNNLVGWSSRGILIEHGSALVASNITVRDNTYTNTGSIVTLSNVTLDPTCRTENWGTETVAASAGAGQDALLDLQTDGVNRWAVRKNGDAESSTYTGSNFEIVGYDNSGAGPYVGMSINRATGSADFNYGLTCGFAGTATRSVVTVDGAQTETNKRITPRIGTVASSATPTINTDNFDQFNITALAAAVTSMTTNLSGTPTDGQPLDIRFKDNGTGRAITWGASFTGTLLSTTVANKTHLQRLKYDAAAAKWAGYLADSSGY